MKHVLTVRQGDQKIFLALYDRFTALSDEKLLEIILLVKRFFLVFPELKYLLAATQIGEQNK